MYFLSRPSFKQLAFHHKKTIVQKGMCVKYYVKNTLKRNNIEYGMTWADLDLTS
jgi:hypothetical protein